MKTDKNNRHNSQPSCTNKSGLSPKMQRFFEKVKKINQNTISNLHRLN